MLTLLCELYFLVPKRLMRESSMKKNSVNKGKIEYYITIILQPQMKQYIWVVTMDGC